MPASQGVKQVLDFYELKGPNFDETPQRVKRVYDALLQTPKPKMTTFPSESRDMIIVKNHVTWSFCPHHLLPVKYTFKVGYICSGQVLGLSKLARLCDWAVARMPLQEDIPNIILDELKDLLNPPGYGVQVYGEHLCMRMRGVKSPCAEAMCNGLRGQLLFNPSARDEFLRA